MTAKELIDQLKKVNGTTRVAIDCGGDVIEIAKVDLDGDEDGIYIVGEDEDDYDGDES